MANSKFGKDFFIGEAYFLIIDIFMAIYSPIHFTKINSNNIWISGLVIFFSSSGCVILFLFVRNMIFLYENKKENEEFGNQFLKHLKQLKVSINEDELIILKKIIFKNINLLTRDKGFLSKLMIKKLQSEDQNL